MKKCELTTSEFELEYNKNYDWSGMSNGDVSLKGIGFVGFLNLGNTCYLNSALQLLLDIEDIRSYFTENYRNIANTSNSYSVIKTIYIGPPIKRFAIAICQNSLLI